MRFRRFRLSVGWGTGCCICEDVSVGKLSCVVIFSLEAIEIKVVMSHVDALLFAVELGEGRIIFLILVFFVLIGVDMFLG